MVKSQERVSHNLRPQKRNNNIVNRDFPGSQWLKCHTPNVGDLGSIPAQGTRSQMLPPRVHMLYLKILYAAMNNEGPTCRNAYCMLSPSSRVQLFVTPWTVASQAPLSMGFSRQEYWSEWVAISFSTCAAPLLLLLSHFSRVRLCATP